MCDRACQHQYDDISARIEAAVCRHRTDEEAGRPAGQPEGATVRAQAGQDEPVHPPNRMSAQPLQKPMIFDSKGQRRASMHLPIDCRVGSK